MSGLQCIPDIITVTVVDLSKYVSQGRWIEMICPLRERVGAKDVVIVLYPSYDAVMELKENHGMILWCETLEKLVVKLTRDYSLGEKDNEED